MFVRKLVTLITLVGFAPVSLSACGGSPGQNAASHALKTPELPTDKQAKCHVAKSQSDPLIVEWTDTQRGQLESISKRGLVAVRYEGCELKPLPGCTVKANGYAYSPITRKQSITTIRDEDALYASMPIGAVKLEGKLKSAGQLNVQMTMVGRFEAPTRQIYRQDLDGVCSEATHVIVALAVGSFTFTAGAGAEVGGDVNVMGAGGGGKSQAMRETLTRDGEEAACKMAGTIDKAPPEGCGALLQIEVVPLAKGAKTASMVVPGGAATLEPTPPPPPICRRGEHLENGVCVSRSASVRPSTWCASGQHEDNGRCVDDEPQAPPPLDCPSGTHAQNGACVADSTPEPAPPSYGLGQADEHGMKPNPMRTVLGYGAVFGGLTALVAGGIAVGTASAAKKECSATSCGPEYDSKRSTAVTYAVVADVALGLGIASAVALLFVPAKIKAGVAPTPNGVAGTIGGQF